MYNYRCIIADFCELLYSYTHTLSFPFAFLSLALLFHSHSHLWAVWQSCCFDGIHIHFAVDAISYRMTKNHAFTLHPFKNEFGRVRWLCVRVRVYVCTPSCCILTKDVSIKEWTNSRGWVKLIFIYSNIYISFTQCHRRLPLCHYPFQLHSHTMPCQAIPYTAIWVLLTHAAVLFVKVLLFPPVLLPWWCILRFIALDRTYEMAFHFWSTTQIKRGKNFLSLSLSRFVSLSFSSLFNVSEFFRFLWGVQYMNHMVQIKEKCICFD